MNKTFRPSDFQPALPKERFLVRDAQLHEEAVPMDVLFVGGGAAGSAGATEDKTEE